MYTEEALRYYNLRPGAKADHDLYCAICAHLMESRVVTACVHGFDFACITIKIHTAGAKCQESNCEKALQLHRGADTMPTTDDLLKYGLRMGRATDFREK